MNDEFDELDELDLNISELDNEVEQPGVGEQDATVNQEQSHAEPINNPENISAMMLMGVSALFPLYPSLEKVYTEDACMKLATASCAVANKRGWDMLGFFGKYQEEIVLVMTAVPLMTATYKAVDNDMKEAEKKTAEEKTGDVKEAV